MSRNLESLRPAAAALLLAVCSSVAAAQARPSFAGEWVRVADSSAAARPSVAATGDAGFRRGDMGNGWGSALTITQTADSLIVTFTQFSAYDLQPKLRYAYALTGGESVNRITIGHGESVQRSRVSWDGAALVITTSYAPPPGVDGRTTPVEVHQALALDAANRLVTETTRSGVAGGAASTVRTVYTRR